MQFLMLAVFSFISGTLIEETRATRCAQSLQVDIRADYINYSGSIDEHDCKWTLHTASYTTIKLTVVSVELGSTNCSNAYIEIRDGTNYGRRLGVICGPTDKVFLSSSQDMEIIYNAGPNYHQASNFKLRYVAQDSSVCQSGDKTASLEPRYITSPNYPGSYPPDLDCEWLIDTLDSDRTVVLQVLSSYLRGSASHCTDYVEALDGYFTTSLSLGRWCNNETPTKRSTSRYMRVIFHSEEGHTAMGFKLSYRAEKEKSVNMVTVRIVAGAVTASILLLSVIICCFCMCFRSRLNRNQGSNNQTSTTNLNVNIYAISSGGVRNAAYRHSSSSLNMGGRSSSTSSLNAPPPAYDDVVKTDITLPPSYLEAVSLEMSEVHRTDSDSQHMHVQRPSDETQTTDTGTNSV